MTNCSNIQKEDTHIKRDIKDKLILLNVRHHLNVPANCKLHYPSRRIGGDNGDMTLYFCPNSPLLGQLFISNPTKAPEIPRKYVRILIHCIVPTVNCKVNVCTICRIYHTPCIMGFSIESMNYMDL